MVSDWCLGGEAVSPPGRLGRGLYPTRLTRIITHLKDVTGLPFSPVSDSSPRSRDHQGSSPRGWGRNGDVRGEGRCEIRSDGGLCAPSSLVRMCVRRKDIVQLSKRQSTSEALICATPLRCTLDCFTLRKDVLKSLCDYVVSGTIRWVSPILSVSRV